MVDLKRVDNEKIEKIGWYLNAPVKLFVVIGIFFLCILFGSRFFLFLRSYAIFEFAIIASFLIFFSLAIALVILINKFRVVERLTDDWYHKK